MAKIIKVKASRREGKIVKAHTRKIVHKAGPKKYPRYNYGPPPDKDIANVDGEDFEISMFEDTDQDSKYNGTKTYAIKLKSKSTGEIKVLPNGVTFSRGYDQGQNSGQQHYPNIAGYGSGNGGGYKSPVRPFLTSRHIEHIAKVFSKEGRDSSKNVRTYPKGTTIASIKDDIIRW